MLLDDFLTIWYNVFMLNRRQEEIIELLSGQPHLRTRELEEALGITRSRINQIIVPLIKKGLVKREGRARATVYLLRKKVKNIDQNSRENWKLRQRILELEKQLDERKIIERAKEILIAQFEILPTDAYRKLQQQSMDSGRSMREIAGSILSAYQY